jgi:hypothetical protein
MWKTWTGSDQTMSPLAGPQTGGPSAGPGGWHPTILYLIALLVAEILIAGLLARTVLR